MPLFSWERHKRAVADVPLLSYVLFFVSMYAYHIAASI